LFAFVWKKKWKKKNLLKIISNSNFYFSVSFFLPCSVFFFCLLMFWRIILFSHLYAIV
jgi:hypothetical protein